MRFLAASAALLVLATSCVTEPGSARGPYPGARNRPTCEEPRVEIEDAGPPVAGGTVNVRLESEPGTLLSMYSPNPVVRHVADNAILEALVLDDPETGTPDPLLAVSWSADREKAAYTFHLNENARWHDGRPFTSADVVFTVEQLLDPAGKSVLRQHFLDIKAVTPADEHTVIFELDEHRADFVEALAQVSILPAHVFGKEVVATHPASRAPVGTGPFVFQRWKSGREISLTRNERYHGAPALVDRLVYKIVPERRVALDMFSSGELDIVTNAGRISGASLKGARTLSYPLHRFEAWIYNTANPIFADAAVRRAVGALIDRRILRASVLGCQADIVDHPWPPGKMRRSPSPRVSFSRAHARALLDSAGWWDLDRDGVREKNGVPLSFTLLLPDSGRDLKRAATVAQQDMAKAGVEMRMTIVGWGVYTNRLRKHLFDASVLTVPNRSPFDPSPLFHSRGISTGTNFGRFEDQETDRILDVLAASTDPESRARLEGELELRLDREQPVSFTFRPRRQLVIRDGLRGLEIADEWIRESTLWWRESEGEP